METKQVRKVFALREVELPMEDLEKGDVFRIQPACEADTSVDPDQYWYAIEDGYVIDGEAQAGVRCEKLHRRTSDRQQAEFVSAVQAEKEES